jgi:hypothetical protein
MSQLIARIMLAILLFPLAGTLYFIVFVVYVKSQNSWSRHNTNIAFLIAGIVSWIFIAGYWYALWRKTVRWTDGRISWTALCFLGAVLAGAVAGAAIYALEDELGVFVGTVLGPLLWQVGTVLVWRESAAERAERLAQSGPGGVVCPTCGYNLTGLKGTRCPECGSEFTLDSLLACQPGKAQAELEIS